MSSNAKEVKQLQKEVDDEAQSLSLNKAFDNLNVASRAHAKRASVRFAASHKSLGPAEQRDLVAKVAKDVDFAGILDRAAQMAQIDKKRSVFKSSHGLFYTIVFLGSGADGFIYRINAIGTGSPDFVVKVQDCSDKLYYNQEIEVMQLATKFAHQGVPHFPVLLYAHETELRGAFCGFAMELAMCDVNTAITNRIIELNYKNCFSIIKQVILAVRFFHEKMSKQWKHAAIHCDFHASNMLVFANADKGVWEYHIDGEIHKVEAAGFYVTSYDYARVNNRHVGHCYLSTAYDYLRAFSSHAGLLRAFKRARDSETVTSKRVVLTRITRICNELLEVIASEGRLNNPVLNGRADWSVGYRKSIKRPENQVLPVQSEFLASKLLQYTSMFEEGLRQSDINKEAVVRKFNFNGNA